MAEFVQINGLRELGERLKALPKEISGKVLQRALRKAAKPVQDNARARVRKKTGTLEANIITVTKRKLRTGEQGVSVTVRAKATKFKDNKANRRKGRVGGAYKNYGPLFYARFLEFGTSKAPAYPFLRPAFEGAKDQMGEILRKELAVEIEKAVKKLGKGR